jgi:hypothetical protein
MEVIDANVRAGIETLVTEFSFLIDHGEASRIPRLFAEDGRFESPMATLVGQQAITAAMAQRQTAAYNTRHVVSNLRLQSVSTGCVKGTLILTLYRWNQGETEAQPQPTAVVEYEDVYERNSDGEWLFTSRKALQLLPTNI